MSIEGTKASQEPELTRRVNRMGQLVEESINYNRSIKRHINFIAGSDPETQDPGFKGSENESFLDKMDKVISLLQILANEQNYHLDRLNKLTGA